MNGVALAAEPRTFRWTRDAYYRMADLGLFQNRRVELLDGEIVEMPAHRNDHAIAIELTGDALRRVFRSDYRVRVQLPLRVDDLSEPEPDFAVIAGSPRGATDHPTTALLVIEVSDTTLLYDRTRKLPRYAQAGVAEYWILNLVDRCLEVHRDPIREAGRGRRATYRYAEVRVVQATGAVNPLAAPKAKVRVADLLP